MAVADSSVTSNKYEAAGLRPVNTIAKDDTTFPNIRSDNFELVRYATVH